MWRGPAQSLQFLDSGTSNRSVRGAPNLRFSRLGCAAWSSDTSTGEQPTLCLPECVRYRSSPCRAHARSVSRRCSTRSPVDTQPPSSTSTCRTFDARASGLEVSTASAYVTLLENLFLIHRLPAWGRTLRARATALPKLHLVDSGLAARLLRITSQRLGRLDPATLTEFGHLLETFVGRRTAQASLVDR